MMFNSIFQGISKNISNDNYILANNLYKEMLIKNIMPSNITFSILVKIRTNCEGPTVAINLLDDMIEIGVKPGLIVYTCLITSCMYKGMIDQAVFLVEKMKNEKIKMDSVVYNTLISGCIKEKNFINGYKFCYSALEDDIKIAVPLILDLIRILLKYNQKK